MTPREAPEMNMIADWLTGRSLSVDEYRRYALARSQIDANESELDDPFGNQRSCCEFNAGVL
jgi:hypothetical protein